MKPVPIVSITGAPSSIEDEVAARVGLIGGSQRIAEHVGHDRAAQEVGQDDMEPGQAHFGGVRHVVDRVVVLEDQDGDLRGGDRVLVQTTPTVVCPTPMVLPPTE